MNGIHCTLMLEDQKEEAACLHVLGLLDPKDERAFEANVASDSDLARTVDDLNDTLTNLSSSTTAIHLPSDTLKRSILNLVDLVPPRVHTDTQGYITEINSAFTGLCGYSFSEIRGKKPGTILQGPDTDPAIVAILRDAVRSGSEAEVEMLNFHKDGTPYWVWVKIHPKRDASGSLTGFYAEEQKRDLPASVAERLG